MNFYLFLVVFLLVDFLLIVYVVYLRSRKRFSQRELLFYKKEWQKIYALQDSKHAIMEADKLLHVVLRKKGFVGGVGEQLKKAGKFFSNTDAVWEAHKLRNRIAHELDVRVSQVEKQHSLHSFEKALKDLGAL